MIANLLAWIAAQAPWAAARYCARRCREGQL